MCVDFTDLNNACPQDCYPLPEIDWKRGGWGNDKYTPLTKTQMEILATEGANFPKPPPMCTLEERRVGNGEISFPTLTADNTVVEPLTIEINAGGHDIYRMYIDGGASADILYEHCFQRLRPEVKRYSPVRQKKREQALEHAKAILEEVHKLVDAGATYQRLVDSAFEGQVGRNLEVYVDDIVIKSHTKDELVRDIKETFRTLRKINMKLNLKKCTFGAIEGMFLGYLIEPDGIKPCPEKTKAVIQLPSPRMMNEVQSLNGKLAGLNRFLSKSADKSLPLFKTLKKCTKKGDFHWTTEILADFIIEKPDTDVAPPRSKVPRSENKKADALSKIASTSFAHLSKQVLVEILKNKSISEMEISTVIEEQNPMWMTHIIEFISKGTQPHEQKDARRIRRKAQRFELRDGPWSVVARALQSGYYWPTMHRDARDVIKKCSDCQVHRPIPCQPQQQLTPITSPWPFYKWGINIVGPFPVAAGGLKFFIVAIRYK
nr:reverse transcriptase domain-containing protein [Tanacetum cinerariifolium]